MGRSMRYRCKKSITLCGVTFDKDTDYMFEKMGKEWCVILYRPKDDSGIVLMSIAGGNPPHILIKENGRFHKFDDYFKRVTDKQN